MSDQTRYEINELAVRFANEILLRTDTGLASSRERFFTLVHLTMADCCSEHAYRRIRGDNRGLKNEEINQLPVFCETTLYALFGKGHARVILALFHQLGEALGITREEQGKWKLLPDTNAEPDFDALEVFIKEHAEYGDRKEHENGLAALRGLRKLREARKADK